jgi:hypothetical protein
MMMLESWLRQHWQRWDHRPPASSLSRQSLHWRSHPSPAKELANQQIFMLLALLLLLLLLFEVLAQPVLALRPWPRIAHAMLTRAAECSSPSDK